MKKLLTLPMAALLAGAFSVAQAAITEGLCNKGNYGAISVQWLNNKCTAVIYGDKTSSEKAGDPTLYTQLSSFEAIVDSVAYQRAGIGKKSQTIVLPFEVSSACSVTGAKISPIGKTANNKETFVDKDTKGVWTVRRGNDLINASGTNSGLTANTPYIAEFVSSPATINISNCEISINTTNDALTLSAGNWQFVGTFNHIVWTNSDLETAPIYGMAAENKDVIVKAADGSDSTIQVKIGDFVKVKENASITPMRAYLRYSPVLMKRLALAKEAVAEVVPTVLRLESDPSDQVPSHRGFVIDTVTGIIRSGSTNWQEIEENFVRVVFEGSPNQPMFIDEEILIDSVEYKRTFTVNTFSTVMFPFDVCLNYNGEGKECVTIAGTNFYKFVGISEESTLDFIHVWENREEKIQANVPYLIQISDNSVKDDGTLFLKVRNDQTQKIRVPLKAHSSQEFFAECDNCGPWQFRGSYNYTKWEAGNSALGKIYGFAAKNKTVADTASDGTISSHEVAAGSFVKAKAGAYLPPMRAYVYYNASKALAKSTEGTIASISTEDLPSSLNVRILDDDGVPMAIGTMNTVTGEITMDENKWFDMKGRMLNKKPTAKGTYYNKGQKVIIK